MKANPTPPTILCLLFLVAAILVAFPSVSNAEPFDDLGGPWTVTLDGKEQKETAHFESCTDDQVKVHYEGEVHILTRTGDTLSLGEDETTGILGALKGEEKCGKEKRKVQLQIAGLDTKCSSDDNLTGTWFGRKAIFRRAVRCKCVVASVLPQLQTLLYERVIEWGGDHVQLSLNLERQADGTYLADIGGEDWKAATGIAVSEAELQDVREKLEAMQDFPKDSFAIEGTHWYTNLKATGTTPEGQPWNFKRWFYDTYTPDLQAQSVDLENAVERLLRKLTDETD